MRKDKKGQVLGGLYGNVLLLVMVGMIIGIGVLVLDKFSATGGVTAKAQTAINASRTAIGDIAEDWMSLIVTVMVLGLILAIVVGVFRGRG